MPKHVVLIDYENVHPRTFESLVHECFHVRLFVGPNQSHLPIELTESMQKLGARAGYIRTARSGKNALDFHIAYYLGALSAEDPQTRFSIVSRDKDIDPLIEHLKGRGLAVERVMAIDEIRGVASSNGKSPARPSHIFAQKLAGPKFPKPRTVETLSNSIGSCFKTLSDKQIAGVVLELIKQGVITVDGTKIVYSDNHSAPSTLRTPAGATSLPGVVRKSPSSAL